MPRAHYELAKALERQGDPAGAREQYEEARRLAPYLRQPDRCAKCERLA
jgi:Flp pilus assembly protein TadD